MAIVLSILRRAHATGTHHQLALDALVRLDVPDRAAWERVFYKHIALYLDGAKAPDNAFKDFENHVLHVRHGFWGGAVGQVETWFAETVDALARQDWPAAAYAAGVLSHYVTDPMQPLHTHQTDAENAIHAGVERSVSRSYAALVTGAAGAALPALSDAQPLDTLMKTGARAANAHYETVLSHYDIKRGVVSPEDGLDAVGQRVLGQQLMAAQHLFGHVLGRAIRAANVVPPGVTLGADACHAFLSLPAARKRRRNLDAADRRLVEAMYDELMATGRVEATLPDDERRIRDLFAAWLASNADGSAVAPVASALPQQMSAPTEAAPSLSPPAPHESAAPSDDLDPEDPTDAYPTARRRLTVDPPRRAPSQMDAPEVRSRGAVQAVETSAAPTPLAMPATFADLKPVRIDAPPTARATPALASYRPSSGSGRSTLSMDADVVDAPSIGAKTAQRMNAVGIDTVGDFLKAHPIALAARLEHASMTAVVLTEWQDQTRLMLSLSDLRAADAKLLVGAGYRTLEAITNVDPDQMSADILRYVLTSDGQAILRDGYVPDVERIRGWAADARAIKAA